jgi:predicted transcriptional regulator
MTMLKDLKRKLLRNPEVRMVYTAFLAAVSEGRKAARKGHVVPHRDVRRWLESWGTDREGKPPRRR